MCIFIYAVKAEIWPRCTAWGKTGSIRVERGLYRKLVLNIFSRPSRQFWSFIKKSTQFFEDVFLKKKIFELFIFNLGCQEDDLFQIDF